MSIGQRLAAARLAHKMTQVQVAEKLHVTRSTISNWENGRSYPDLDSLLTLSSLFEISVDSLLKQDAGLVKDVKNKEQQRKAGVRLLWANAAITVIIAVILGLNLFAVQGFTMDTKVRWILLVIFILNVAAERAVLPLKIEIR